MIKAQRFPFKPRDLEPYLSATNISDHYNINYLNYVKNTNDLIVGTDLEHASLDKILATSKSRDLKHQAGQVRNHNILWQSLCPCGKSQFQGSVFEIPLLNRYGTYDKFKAAFVKAGVKQFGSGWLWIDSNGIMTTTPDGETFESTGHIIAVDLWEHSYQVDYPGARKAYLEAVLNVLHWNI